MLSGRLKRLFLKRGIQQRLVLHILLVGLLPLVLGLGLTYYYGIRALRVTIGSNFKTIAVETGKRVDSLLQDEIWKLRGISTVPIVIVRAVSEANQDNPNRSDETLEILRGESSRFLRRVIEMDDRPVWGILLTDRYGRLVASSSTPRRSYFGDDPGWKAALREGKVHISGVLPIDSGTFEAPDDVFEITLPIRDLSRGNLIGALQATYSLSYLGDAIHEVRVGRTGHAMLFDSEGTPLICPLLPRSRHMVQPALMRKILSPTPGWTIAPDDAHGAQDTIVGYAPLPTANSLGATNLHGKSWHIFIRQDPDESYAPAYDLLKRVAVLGGVLVGLLTLSGLYVGTRISRPIQELQEGARRIGEGNLSYRLSVRTRDELELLAREFNRMVEKIQEAQEALGRCNRDLESKVQERTKELIRSEEKRHEAYAQVMHADKLASLGQMAAGVAHEVGNPLSSISAIVQILKAGEATPEEEASYLASLNQLVNRIDRTLRSILTFTRPSPQKVELVDLNQTIEEAVQTTSPDVRFRKIRIDRGFVPDLPKIQGDYSQLVQVFVNLLKNAADAVSSDGTITIELEEDREKEKIMIRFSDNGHGIPPEALPRIFEPFYTTKAPGQGTGLGLSICRSIIEGLKGRIEAESAVGKGTTFTLTLPIGTQTVGDPS